MAFADDTDDDSPRKEITMNIWKSMARIAALTFALMIVALAGASPVAAVSSQDLYSSSAVRYQDPDYTACTATSTQIMLNTIAFRGTGGDGFVWKPTTSYTTQETILKWERAHDTEYWWARGSDPQGWALALNYFGYGNANAGVYKWVTYTSFDAATRGVVQAMAKYHKPVGILAWWGGHANLLTGYTATGDDPAVSTNFKMTSVRITDPLRSQYMRDKYVSYNTYRYGAANVAWRQYWQTDTVYKGWYGRWVAIIPTR